MIEDAFAGIVIIANNFNPSIYTESWLLKLGLVSVENLVGPRICSPDVTQYQTEYFQILILSNRLQILFGLQNEAFDYTIPLTLANHVIQAAPLTPFNTIGLNFDYLVNPDELTFADFNRALLGHGSSKLFSEFSSDDARFGSYFSKDYGEARLKLDIKPFLTQPAKKEFLKFSFNFHHDLYKETEDGKAEKIKSILESWETLESYSKELVELGTRI